MLIVSEKKDHFLIFILNQGSFNTLKDVNFKIILESV